MASTENLSTPGVKIKSRTVLEVIFGILILVVLYLGSRQNYLLFHSLAELFSIVVAAGIFMVAWNSRKYLDNKYFLFIGVAYLFVAGLDTFHTIAYKGMGVFPDVGTNLATQLWVAARYLEALSLLIAPLFIVRRRLNAGVLLAVYAGTFTLIIASIFYWKIFPAAYIEGQGLTTFKVFSEYLISLFLAGAAALLYLNRQAIDTVVYRLLTASILLTIASEMSFTLYTDPYGLMNMIGHFLKIVSFYLIYRAIVVTALQEPYKLLYRNTSQQAGELTKLFFTLAEPVLIYDSLGKITQANPAAVNSLGFDPVGYDKTEFSKKLSLNTLSDKRSSRKDLLPVRALASSRALNGETIMGESFEYIDGQGRQQISYCNAAPLKTKEKIIGAILSWQNITDLKRAEEKIKKSEHKYRSLFDNMIEGFAHHQIVTDTEGRAVDYIFLEANQAFEDMTGLKVKDIIGKKVTEVIPGIKDDPADWIGRYGRLALGELKELKFEQYANDLKRWYSVTAFSPRPDHFATIFTDITERKITEDKIKNLALFPEQNPFPILRVNRDGELIFSNQSSGRLLDTWHCRIGQAVPGSVQDKIKQAIKTGKVLQFEAICQSKIYNLSISPVPDRGYVNIYGHDITKRKQAEKALQAAELNYRTVADFTYDWETWVNPDKTYRYVSPSSERITGYRREEFYRDREFMKKLIIPEDYPVWENHRHEQQSPGNQAEMQRIQFRIRHKDGSVRWIEHACLQVTSEAGDFLGFRTSNRDITDIKEMELKMREYNKNLSDYARRLQASNQELEAFTYSVSHDLRAPLRSIDGFSQAVLEDYTAKLDAKGADYLGRVRAASQSMGRLIDDLLRLSRLARGELALKEFNISRLAESVAAGLKQREPGRKLDFTIMPDIIVRADERLVRIALENLMANACKFTGTCETAEIEFAKVPGSGHSVFYVRDNGIGFNMEYSDKLFAPFQRLHSSNDYPGTGIGLAIVSRVITRHGGKVWAEAEEGKGATFFFTL